jgi:hypothetical protein
MFFPKVKVKVHVKQSLYRTWKGPEGSMKLRLPEFIDNRYMKAVMLSALRTGHLSHPHPPKIYPWYPFLLDAERVIVLPERLSQ